jgi:hypothetical protein
MAATTIAWTDHSINPTTAAKREKVTAEEA